MTKVFIEDLKLKEQVETSFIVKFINMVEARNGTHYLNVVLGDSTGDLDARAWVNVEEIASAVKRGDYVKVEGKLNLYQNKKQFVISKIEKIDEADIVPDDYVAKSALDPHQMFEELNAIVKSLKDVYIKDLLLAILNDSEIERRLKLWPAGKTIHHAYQSGLLEHILSCTKLSQFLSSFYKLNENYVIAGAILHDLCKIFELSDGPVVDYTDEGKLVGHLVKGPELLEKYSRKIKGFPKDLKNHLKHILLSHHGEYEYGSPKLPQTKEAYLVHLIDHMDSKINAVDSIIKRDQSPGNWSSFVKHLDRIIYKKELPFYPKYIETAVKEKPKKQRGSGELKQNMGKLLEGFEVKD